jgi:hypothetical protein
MFSNLLLAPNLNQLNPIHVLMSCLFKVLFDTVFLFKPLPPKWPFLSGLMAKKLRAHRKVHIRRMVKCISHLKYFMGSLNLIYNSINHPSSRNLTHSEFQTS